jgi:hypothetical protein
MELDKDLPLFSIIHNQLELLRNNDTNELEITFYKAEGTFTEFEFNNFTNVCRSFNCKESIDNEYLEVTGDNNILHIEGISNIMKYCITDTFDNKKTKWVKEQMLNANNIDANKLIENIYYLPQIFNGIDGNLTLQEVIDFLNIFCRVPFGSSYCPFIYLLNLNL